MAQNLSFILEVQHDLLQTLGRIFLIVSVTSDHPESIDVVVNIFTFYDFPQTAAQICFKFCEDVFWLDPYQVS